MRLTPEEFRKEIDLAIAGGYAIVFKEFFKDITPGWQEILDCMDTGYQDDVWGAKPSGYPKKEPVVGGRLTARGRFYITNRLDSDCTPFEEIKPGFEYLNSVVPETDLMASHLLVTLVSGEPYTETDVHSDPPHTFYWQLQGSSEWRLFEEPCCVYCDGQRHFDTSAKTSPGDLLFSPSGMFHTIHITGPRAAVVFRFNQENELARTPRPKIEER